jgi:hypothetical protein
MSIKYTARRISGIYRAEKRRAIEMAPYFSISRNIEGHKSHNIEDKIHCTVSKSDETFEIFFNHL